MTRSASTSTWRNARVRCAIYTRKSSGEGWSRNSIRCRRSAFINSQRREGWVCLPDAYDDGGCSGATMDRATLQRLLADIAAGRVDTVVVYKIDRLTRSLADFANRRHPRGECARPGRSRRRAGVLRALADFAAARTASAHPISRGVRVSYLAPDITQAILGGRQPRGLTAARLLAHSRLPLAWHEQRLVLGFA